MKTPIYRPAADAGWRVPFAFQRPWPRAAQAGRPASLRRMRLSITSGVLLIATIGACAAGDIKLFVESYPVANAVCVITNSTEHEVYVLPICISEEFYATPNCSDCATNWIARRPAPLGEWRDLIPLAPKASLRFNVIGFFSRPWRVTTVAFTKRVQIPDSGTPPPIDPKDRIELRTAKMQPKTHL
jgi:hypothetical protein